MIILWFVNMHINVNLSLTTVTNSFVHPEISHFLILRSCRSPWRQSGGEDFDCAQTLTWTCNRHTGGHAGAHESAAYPSLTDHPGPWLSCTEPVSASHMNTYDQNFSINLFSHHLKLKCACFLLIDLIVSHCCIQDLI